MTKHQEKSQLICNLVRPYGITARLVKTNGWITTTTIYMFRFLRIIIELKPARANETYSLEIYLIIIYATCRDYQITKNKNYQAESIHIEKEQPILK